VAVRHPCLGCICMVRGFAAETTLELLMSNPPDSRALMRPLSLSGTRDRWSVIAPFEGLISRALGSGHVAVTLTW
jgi:hypothetical protein